VIGLTGIGDHDARIGRSSWPECAICACRAFVPSPRVAKCLDLRGGLRAVFLGKEHVITGVRIERGIEVHEVNGFVLDVTPKHVEVISVVQAVHCRSVTASPYGLSSLVVVLPLGEVLKFAIVAVVEAATICEQWPALPVVSIQAHNGDGCHESRSPRVLVSGLREAVGGTVAHPVAALG
jgi:hypothetical protein